MKNITRKILSLALVFAIALAFAAVAPLAASALSQQEAADWAKSKVGQYLDYDGAYGAQCVDLIKYYYVYLGVSATTGNGKDYWTNSLPSGWTRIGNTADFVPQPGDIAVWNGYVGDGAGHVAIIISANINNFTSIDQNWPVGSAVAEVNHGYNNFYGVIRPSLSGGSSNNNNNNGGGGNNNTGNPATQITNFYYSPNPAVAGQRVTFHVSTSADAKKIEIYGRNGSFNNTLLAEYEPGGTRGEWDLSYTPQGAGTFDIQLRAIGNSVVNSDRSFTVGGGNSGGGSSSGTSIKSVGYPSAVTAGQQVTFTIQTSSDVRMIEIYPKDGNGNYTGNTIAKSEPGYTQSNWTLYWTPVSAGKQDFEIRAFGNGQAQYNGGYNYYGSITVNNAPTLSYVSVRTQPTKLNYYDGDTLNTSGLSLNAVYSDGSTKTITSGFTCSPTKLTANLSSSTPITVAYSGKTTTFSVFVDKKAVAVGEEPSEPEKQALPFDGWIETSFDGKELAGTVTVAGWAVYGATNTVELLVDGVSVGTATRSARQDVLDATKATGRDYSKGTPKPGFSIKWNTAGVTDGAHTLSLKIIGSDGKNSLTEGFYGGQSRNKSVVVKNVTKVTLSSITVKTPPTKVNYYNGDTLDTSGLSLTAAYSDGSTKTITSGFTCSPTKLAASAAASIKITVTYEGKTAAFIVRAEPKTTAAADPDGQEPQSDAENENKPEAAASAQNPYYDVFETDPYYEAVLFVYERGLMIGRDTGMFDPQGTLTREEAITIIARLSGDEYLNYAGQSPFSDVEANRWSAGAIAWARATGITNGVGGGRFGPSSNVTYDQFEVMLMRHYGLLEKWNGSGFDCSRANAAALLYSYAARYE